MIQRSHVLISLLAGACALAACSSSDAPSGTETAGAHAGGNSGSTAPGGAASAGAAHGGSSPGGTGAGGAGTAGAAPGGAPAGGSNGGHAGSAGTSGHGGIAGTGNAGEAGSGEAGSNGEGGAPNSAPEIAYVGTILSGLFPCSVDPTSGVPTLQPGGAIAPHSNVAMLAVDPAQRFLYVADENKHVDSYAIGADGKLPMTPSSTIATTNTLNTLAVDPLGRFVYAGSGINREIYVLAVTPETGKLVALGDPVLVGDEQHGGVSYLAADPSGQFLYVSQTFGFGIRGYSVSAAGKLDEIAGSPFGATSIPGDHNVLGGTLAFEPGGDFLYASGNGLNAFKLEHANGKLDLVAGSPFTLDLQSDPDATNIAIDPQGSYLYAVNFLLTNHVTGFKINPQSGALAQVPGDPLKLAGPYSVSVDRSGRFLYVGLDGPDGLGVYSIARSNGTLTQVQATSPGIGGLEPIVGFASLR